MTHAWKQTINMNEAMAAELITAQHFAVHTIFLLDSGWDNEVYCVNNEFIFRFPRRECGVSCMKNEIALTSYVHAQVSFPLSAAQWIGQPTDQYPYAYAGYPMLLGKPLCEATNALIDNEQFAIILATWLKELHHIPVRAEHIQAVKGNFEWKVDVPHRTLRCQENLQQYLFYFAEAGFNKNTLLELIEYMGQWHFESVQRSFVHGDLYSRHIMVNPDTLLPNGLIDWGDMHIGHPAIDLSSGMIFTKKSFDAFLNAYGPIDETTQRLLLFNSFCHSLSFLPYAFEQKKASLKQWATLALQRAFEEIQEYQRSY